MAVQAWKRRLACEWSILALFPSLENCTLFGQPYQKSGFLWTFTSKTPEQRESVDLTRSAFHLFLKWARRHGYVFLWALERGKKSGHYHYHLVTNQYWSAKTLWTQLEQWGFSPDVQQVPRERLAYAAKYVGKQRMIWPIPARVKRWGTCGYKGVKTNSIEFSERSLTIIPSTIDYPYRRKRTWLFADTELATQRFQGHDWPESETVSYTMKVTQENLLHVASLLAKGNILALGEYRTCQVRELKFTDKDSKAQKVRKIVEHGIEVGDAQITVSTWLPDDADITKYQKPAEKGDPVVVEVEGFNKQYGITAKSIRTLSSMGGKLV